MASAALMKRTLCGVALALLTLSSAALAAPTDLLSANPDSYLDPTWRGSVTFHDASGGRVLKGRIDYAVFLSDEFNANYPANPQPGPVVYAYQLFVDSDTVGSDISHLTVMLNGDITNTQDIATDITFIPSEATGYPSSGATAPTVYSLDPDGYPLPTDSLYDTANWSFGNVIPSNGYSQILVFSSEYLPIMGSWGVDDSGLSDGYGNTNFWRAANSLGPNLQTLPTPGSDQYVPEPATLTLLGLAGMFGAPGVIRRFRRR